MSCNSKISFWPPEGAILHPDNRALLRKHGTVIYLCAPVTELRRRTHQDKNRPLLQTGNAYAKLLELFAQRDPLYRETAHIIMDSGKQSARAFVQKLMQKLRQLNREQPIPVKIHLPLKSSRNNGGSFYTRQTTF